MDKILKSKGNVRGNILVMALQDLYYSFVCSQNQKAVQTLGDLHQIHCLEFWLVSSLAQKALPVAESDLAWGRTGQWPLKPFFPPCPGLHLVALRLHFPFTKCSNIIWACLGELSCAWAMQLSTSCLCLSSSTMVLFHSVHFGKIWVASHCAWEWPDPGMCTHPTGWRKARLANFSFVSMQLSFFLMIFWPG